MFVINLAFKNMFNILNKMKKTLFYLKTKNKLKDFSSIYYI